MEEGKLLGIFTGTELIERVVAVGLDPNRTLLHKVMTKNPKTIPAQESAVEALRRTQRGGYRHLSVVDRSKIVGIVSRRDFYGFEVAEIERENKLWKKRCRQVSSPRRSVSGSSSFFVAIRQMIP